MTSDHGTAQREGPGRWVRTCQKCFTTYPATSRYFGRRKEGGRRHWHGWCRRCTAAAGAVS